MSNYREPVGLSTRAQIHILTQFLNNDISSRYLKNGLEIQKVLWYVFRSFLNFVPLYKFSFSRLSDIRTRVWI